MGGMNGDFAQKLNQLVAASGGRVTIGSGYRNSEQQQKLWADALVKYNYDEHEARKWVAKPGYSNHEKGFAADLGGDLALAHQLAPQFGLYFPMNGTGGKGNEPWHVEPVGSRGSGPTNNDAYALSGGNKDLMGTTPPNDPMDEQFNKLGKLFSGTFDVGETDTSAVGEFSAATMSTDEGTGGTDLMGTPTGGAKTAASTGGTPGAKGGDINAFMTAISGQESGGNYNAVNGRTGASGRFQIMPGNWPAWSKEAGLGAGAPRTPENQDKVAQFKMQQYYNQYGDWGKVAEAWYGGGGAVNYSPEAKARKQGGGKEPSIDEYRNSILSKMGAK